MRAANTAFYEAFDKQDMAAMRRVWGRGDHVQCMHPGSANIIGSDPVMRSWEVIMQAAGGGGQRMGVRCTSVRLHISQDMAYVTCEEAVGTDEPGFGLYATNVSASATVFQMLPFTLNLKSLTILPLGPQFHAAPEDCSTTIHPYPFGRYSRSSKMSGRWCFIRRR